MNRMKSILLVVMLILLLIYQSQAQQLKFVQGALLTYGGNPLANQTILLEGRKEPRWFEFFRSPASDKVKLIAITDSKGFFQIVDLPPGEYTLNLVRAGEEKLVPVRKFKLEQGYQNTDVTTKLDLKESLQFKESLGVDVLRHGETEQPK